MLSRFSDFENTFVLMDELQRRIDRIWEDADQSWRSWQSESPKSRSLSASAFPRINLFDAGSSLVLEADVPGLSETDVHVTLSDGGISLSGERKVVVPEGYSAHRQERSHVKFSRSMTLPCKVNPEQATASVKDGVLTITLAKAAEAQPRQISVPVHQPQETVAPPVDVYENRDELLLVADLPGARSDAIDIQLETGQLNIHAKRSDDAPGTRLATEYRAGDYFRSFSVPSGIDASKIGAQFTAGVLHLHLPKSELLKPRRIDVKPG